MPTDTPTVAIIEDNTTIADLYELWLRPEYTVEAAYTCEQAEFILDDTVDLALLDRSLPDGSGDELLVNIRNRGLTFPVAIVSAEIPGLDIIGMEFDAYHPKPIGGEKLLDTVQTLLEETTHSVEKQEFYAITRKKAVLEKYRSEKQLQASEEFTRLTERRRKLEASVETQSGASTETLQAPRSQITLNNSE